MPSRVIGLLVRITMAITALSFSALHAGIRPVDTPPVADVRTHISEMERDMVRAFGWAPKRVARKPTAAPSVGTKRDFWAQGWNSRRFYAVSATCRAVGEHAYLFVDDDMWNRRVRQQDVDALQHAFDRETPASRDRGIFGVGVDAFGEPPDVDGEPGIYILILDIEDDFDDGRHVAGYFSGVNEYTDDEARSRGYRSNEMEIVFLDCLPADVSSPRMHGVLMHEFQHMIHFNADPREETWINEGCSTFAEFVAGYGVRTPSSFRAEPGNSLVQWEAQVADYEQGGMFVDYVFEHWGGAATIKALVANVDHGERGVTTTLRGRGYAAGFYQVFSDWVIANYLDDERVGDGRYAYANYDLSGMGYFAETRHASYPASGSKSVAYAAADYIGFACTGESERQLEVSFTGDARREFEVQVVVVRNDAAPRVHVMPLDHRNKGVATFSDCERVVLIPRVATRTNFPVSYSYAAREVAPEHDGVVGASPLPSDSELPLDAGEVAELAYDDGDYNLHLYWNLDGEGSGVRFTPPYLPAKLVNADFYVSSVNFGSSFRVRVFEDDGTGLPGKERMTPVEVEAPGIGWICVDLAHKDIEIESDFHIMFQIISDTLRPTGSDVVLLNPSRPYFGAEDHAPASGRSWDLYYPSSRLGDTATGRPVYERIADYDYALRAVVTSVLADTASGTAIEAPTANPQPAAFSLAQNYPNPFNASTTIRYQIAAAGRVTLSVHNLLGQEIRTVVDAETPPGSYTSIWDGTDDSGKTVANGMYFYRLQCATGFATKRMILLR